MAPVDEEDDPVGVRRGAGVVGDHDHRLAELVDDGPEEAQQLGPGLGVQRSSGLVREHDVGAVDEGAGHGDPLLLSSRQLGGPVPQPVAEVKRRDHGGHPRRVRRAAGRDRRGA